MLEPMSAPAAEPIGLHVTRVAKSISRAFDDALVADGGSLPVWLVLVALKSGRHGAQRELAEAVGIEGPTLTHHLNRMEREGLVTRRRDPDNRRVHRVELTAAGEDSFARLLATVAAFDRRLRHGFTTGELDALGDALDRLRANVAGATRAEATS
jgi:MarR family transcriptional regulator for hemolysin